MPTHSNGLINRRRWLQATTAATVGVAAGVRSLAGRTATDDSVAEAVTTVREHRGKPAFFLQGEPYAKPVFETYAPRQKYFDQFAAAGSDVFSFSVSFGLYQYTRPMWTGPDQWDFSEFDERVSRVLHAAPNGWVTPRIFLGTPSWWLEQNPGELQILHDGSTVYPSSVNSPVPKNQPFASLASQRWRDQTAAGLEKLIEHAESSPYADHLFGYMVTGLFTEEWYHWSSGSELLADYSPHMVQAYQAWLRAKYGDDKELRRAWGNESLTIDTVAIPAKAERVGDSRRAFRDPQCEMAVIDYYLFYNDIIPDTINHFLGVAKRASGGRRAIGTFYGYQFEFNGNPEFGHNSLGRLLDSPHLNFLMVTASYANRELGTGSDYMRSPMTSVAMRGKLWHHDNDTVGHLFYQRHPQPPSEQILAEGERLGATVTAEETIWKHRRGAGFVLGNGAYQSFFDLHGGYFDAPEVMAEVERLNRVFDKSINDDRTSCAEILVVTDESSCAYATFNSPLLEQSLRMPQPALTKIGASHDSILLEDLPRVNLTRYKMVLFLNAYVLTAAQRRFIKDRVMTDARTVVWFAAPGLFADGGARQESLHDVTGIDLALLPEAPLVDSMMELVRSDHPLSAALKRSGVRTMGHGTRCYPALRLEDGQANVIAQLAGSASPALVVKDLATCRSIYCVTPALPPKVFRILARAAGAHIYVDRDDAFYASQSYVTLAADGDGRRTLRLPQPCDIWDPFSGDQLAKACTEYRRPLRDKQTLVLRLTRQ
jgi:hypothetical protein